MATMTGSTSRLIGSIKNRLFFLVLCFIGGILYVATRLLKIQSPSLHANAIQIYPDSLQWQLCPHQPPNLVGRVNVTQNVTLAEAEDRLLPSDMLLPGGSFSPTECQARWKVAIIVPFRNREQHLGSFLNHMHPFLQKQQLTYTIYLVIQKDASLFNRAKLLNVGFLEAEKDASFDCFAFHDVDLLPEDDRHLYHCSDMPRHLNVAPSNANYKPSYIYYYGGVCLMTGEHLNKTNGWSNRYWGWGAEDDDMMKRIRQTGMVVWRYPKEIARYTMLEHQSSVINENRYEDLQRNINYFKTDGLNTLEYKILSKEKLPLFTSIEVDISS